MVKQSKLHFWSSTEDFLTEKGQNCLSQWSCIGGVYFHLCMHYQHQYQVQQRNNPHFFVIQRQNTLLKKQSVYKVYQLLTEIYTSGSITEQMATDEEKVIFNICPHQSKTKKVSFKAKTL